MVKDDPGSHSPSAAWPAPACPGVDPGAGVQAKGKGEMEMYFVEAAEYAAFRE